MVGNRGFEPPQPLVTDLQSAATRHLRRFPIKNNGWIYPLSYDPRRRHPDSNRGLLTFYLSYFKKVPIVFNVSHLGILSYIYFQKRWYEMCQCLSNAFLLTYSSSHYHSNKNILIALALIVVQVN